MFSIYKVMEILYNDLIYEQRLVSYIDEDGLQHYANSFPEILRKNRISIKIEGMEKFSRHYFEYGKKLANQYGHNGPVTCHLFYAKENSPSFGMHTDPDDVIIYCVEGKKTMIIEDVYTVIEPGEEVYIPRGTLHQALNEYEALTLSYGLERFIEDKLNELDVLPQNDGDL
jgi:mannose-6-phosphate isomerase-like protein (cupin superfamily)